MLNSAKQYVNSAKQYINSKFMWGYCSRAEKKKKKKKKEEAENVDVENAVSKRYLSETDKMLQEICTKKKWILGHKSQKYHDPTAVTNRTNRGRQASQILMWRDMAGVLDVFRNDAKAPIYPMYLPWTFNTQFPNRPKNVKSN